MKHIQYTHTHTHTLLSTYSLGSSLVFVANVGHDHRDNVHNLPEENRVEAASTLRIRNFEKVPNKTFELCIMRLLLEMTRVCLFINESMANNLHKKRVWYVSTVGDRG